jgi:dephospho-CoA kinase
MFAELGVPVLDLDKVGRKLTQPGGAGLKALKATFGSGILRPDGSLDREKLAGMSFADKRQLKMLTDILHPMIWERERIWLVGLDAPYAIVEAVVLLESGGAGRMDAIIAVISDLELRRQRVLSRGYPSLAHFEKIIRNQCRDEDRLQAADFVIYNNHGLDELRSQVTRIHHELLVRFSGRKGCKTG